MGNNTAIGAPDQPVPEEIAQDIFPVTFCVIVSNEDVGLLGDMMDSLPPRSEICILTNMPMPSDQEEPSLSEWETQEMRGHVVHNRKWLYQPPFHFGEARNLADEIASNDWIMWLDADDRLAECQHETLRKLAETATPGTGGAFAGVASYEAPKTTDPNDYGQVTGAYQLRFYRKSTGARWECRIHEQMNPALQRLGWGTIRTAVMVIHIGYNQSPKKRLRKLQRNAYLLNIAVAETPRDDEYYGFYVTALRDTLNSIHDLETLIHNTSE